MQDLSLRAKIDIWQQRINAKERDYLNKRHDWLVVQEIYYQSTIEQNRDLSIGEKAHTRKLYSEYIKSFAEFVVLKARYQNFKLRNGFKYE